MIRVTFRPNAAAVIDVEVPDSKLEAVLIRAAERVFPGPVDPKAEAASESRYLVAKRMYAERMAKAK